MKSATAIALALCLAACAPASSPGPSPATATVAPTATAVATASPAPTVAPTLTGTPITLPAGATISAPTGDIVWVLVGGTRLFRSSDRGATWQERGVPPAIPIADIAFINDREGWLSSPGSGGSQCQTQSVGVYHTVDGAATWERVFQSDSTDAGCKGGLSFADGQRGFMTVTPQNVSSLIAHTSDGGRTWTRSQSLADPPGFTSQGGGRVLQTARTRSFGPTSLVSAVGSAPGTFKIYAFRSTDGGATWSYASSAPQNEVEIAFVTATRWLQIFLPNQSSETTDAGATWHAFTTDYGQAAPVSPQIVFGDANVGYATVRGSIQRTLDGGAHWTGIKTPGT